MNVSIDQMVDVAEDLVKFSASAMDIYRLAGDEEAGMPDLVSSVEADPNFSMSVLRIANSAAYLRGEPTVSIAQAIMRIGRKELGQMAFAAACMEGMEVLEGDLLHLKSLWRDGMMIGGIARELSAVAPTVREYSFAAGMLHSIGTMVLSSQIPDKMTEALNMSLDFDLPLHLAEEEVIGFSNAALGGAMARRWNFPEPLAMAIEFQYAPENAPEHKDIVAVMAIASLMMEQALEIDDFDQNRNELDQMLDKLDIRAKFEMANLDTDSICRKLKDGDQEAA